MYESRHGQTAKIAERVADAVQARGVAATVVPLGELPTNLDPRAFDLVVVGASVHYGRHPKSAKSFVREHRDAWDEVPTAFFSVSGHAIDGTPEGDALARAYVDTFLGETGWSPGRVAMFGGAIRFTRYNVLLRFVMKRIEWKAGRSTDTSRDHEYTDWGQVEDFGRALFRTVNPRED